MLTSLLDGRVFAERLGSGTVAVVGLHGWGRSRHDLVRALESFDALSLDLPGFGASPPPDAPCGAAGYAHVLAEVLDELDGPPVVAVGHSFGGRVAVAAAAARPDLFAGLVLTGVPLVRLPGTARPPRLRFRVARALHRRGLLGDARFERARERHGSDDYRRATGVMRGVLVAVVNESYEDELAWIRCPVELVWGADDTVVPVAVAGRAAELLTRARLTTLPGVGHDTPADAPDAVRDAATRLLRETSTA